ncbi:MAG: amidohydrolase family protein [Pseudomonadota bacterium]
MKILNSLCLLVCLLCVFPDVYSAPAVPELTPAYDVLIRGARVLDGSGNPWFRADIGVRGDRIVALGQLSTAVGRRQIDGRELIAMPGFIDTHSHTSDALISEDRSGVPALLAQGITTVLVNPDGGGAVDLPAQARSLAAHGLGVNTGQMVPHGSIRQQVMGHQDRHAEPAELARMAELVRAGMEWGAFGLSSGPFYAPGSFAPNAEFVALARIAGEYGGVYASHIRDESNYSIGLLAAIDEVIEVAREARVTGVVTHIKALGPPVWGLSRAATARIESARAAGISVYTDQYPYAASSTSLGAALLPRWAMADSFVGALSDPGQGELYRAVQENLARRGGADRISFSRSSENPEVVGKTLSTIAQEKEIAPVDAALALLDRGNPGIISFNMQDEDIEHFMRQEWNMTASDGAYPVWESGAPHPRGFGTFPRKFRLYVYDKKVISLPFAVRSMTSLPAQVYGIKGRGQLAVGAYADIVLIDPHTISDRATFAKPYQLAEGVTYVLVNGQLAWGPDGVGEGRYGRLLRREQGEPRE